MIRESFVTFNSVEKSERDVAQMIEQRQMAGFRFDVAVAGKQVLGFATYSQFRAGAGYLNTMEHTLVLAPDAQGQGVGRELIQSIEEHARKSGVHSMFAGVCAENPGGIAFHKVLGYRQVAVLPEVGRKFDRWLDLHLMQKLL